MLSAGWTSRTITAAVRSGRLIRARENVYLVEGSEQDVIDACRIGGLLTCVSELRRREIFVLDDGLLHVALSRSASRLGPCERRTRLHWTLRPADRPARAGVGAAGHVDLIRALAEACRCQEPRAAVATLDSAWNRAMIDEADLGEIFAMLPRRYRVIRRLLDRRAESGPESLMRLILRRLGCAFEPQVQIDGVGRVDFVVDGWLIIECDSKAHHADWDAQRRDRRRDQAAAARGFATYRPIAEDLLWHADRVVAAVRGLVGLGLRRRRAFV